MALTKIDDRGLKTPIDLVDNEKIRLGTGNDLQTYHDGTNSYLTNATNDLLIQNTGDDIYIDAVDDIFIRTSTNEDAIKCLGDGAVELYHNNTKRCETTSSGTKVYGNLTFADDLNTIRLNDNYKIQLGTSQDLQIYHDGSHSLLKNSTGYLRLATGGSGVTINNDDNSETMAAFVKNGAVELYYDNSKKLETTSEGVTLRGTIHRVETLLRPYSGVGVDLGTTADRWRSIYVYSDIDIKDNGKLLLGDSDDLEIVHDGSHSRIKDVGTGKLILQGSEINLNNAASTEYCLRTLEDGAVELYYDNTKKFETTSDGYYYYGTITGGSGARSNAGITQANVHTPAARFFTGGFENTNQNITFQATTGNWVNGHSGDHRSCGLLFNRITSNTQEIRAGIQHDVSSTEKFKFHTSYGDIHFRTRNGNNGNQTWEQCDRDPLVLHHNGHVSMCHMPYIKWNPGGDSNTYQSDATEHIIDGTAGSTIENGMSLNTSNGRITVPYTGVYQINANIGLYRNYDTARSRLNLMKNGSDIIRQEHSNDGGGLSDGGWKTFTLVHCLELSANDYISFDCVGKHDSGAYAVVSVVMLHGTATT